MLPPVSERAGPGECESKRGTGGLPASKEKVAPSMAARYNSPGRKQPAQEQPLLRQEQGPSITHLSDSFERGQASLGWHNHL